MEKKTPSIHWLLLIYLCLPFKSPILTQIILCQIQGSFFVHRATKKLQSEDREFEELFPDLWRSLWFDPNNNAATAYWGMMKLAPIFITYQTGDRLSTPGFTLIGKAVPEVAVRLTIEGKLSRYHFFSPAIVLFQGILMTDESGEFRLEFRPEPNQLPIATYEISGLIETETYTSEIGQIKLIQGSN
ncbi:hypothetical protein JJD41_11295 [Oxynema sp. CENA135]|uniref:hypothetical protein n=1 Tax=Oxynema sp. CENA135 TaxID=984206 RepID=UPI001909E8C7|nr:hypothetical protein [Oxynema sp. CENA135]MBK4730442.1 hypothetical protein [Oxynema sp. CENA135]